jgi:hypothetical protein
MRIIFTCAALTMFALSSASIADALGKQPGTAMSLDATGQPPVNYFGNTAPGAGSAPAPVPSGSPAPAGDLAQSLVGSKWSWGGKAITFGQDSATFPGWTAVWKVTGPREVTLTMVTPKSRVGQVAVFDFGADLKTLTGHDFAGRKIASHRQN